MPEDAALRLLSDSPTVQIASTDEAGRPVLRTVNAVLDGRSVAFHGAPAGEKMEMLGREAVVQCEETIASVPSYFVDPERACPATTYYRSVQVHGRLERVDDPDAKAQVLQLLMEKLQPEGGHAPVDATTAMYRKAVAGVLVVRVPIERIDGKHKLAQNRTPAEVSRILERLWERGSPGDARAIDLVRDANPGASTPAFLRGPAGTTLRCSLTNDEVAHAVELVADEYWNAGTVSRHELAHAFQGSSACVGARDASGDLIATARAVSDGAKHAWVYDVGVAPSWRRQGVGGAIVRLLLDHPAVRRARWVHLQTRDAQRLYARLGFVDSEELRAQRPYRSTTMTLQRRPADAASDAPRNALRSSAPCAGSTTS